MRKKITASILIIWVVVSQTNAQVVSRDSLESLHREKKVLELSRDINENKLKLAQLQIDLQEKSVDMQQLAGKAQASADANTRAAAALTTSPQDRKLANRASRAAKDAQRDAKNARTASESIDNLKKNIQKLEKELQGQAEQLNSFGGQLNPKPQLSQPAVGAREPLPDRVNAKTETQGEAQGVATVTPKGQTAILRDNIAVDTAGLNNVSAIAQKVVESTYRNYPQHQGQPAIIINNIIVPSDYNATSQPAAPAGWSPQELDDYRAWRQYRGTQAPLPVGAPLHSAYPTGQAMPGQDEKLTFTQRFAEKPARNSGLWVIPMAGIHASNFKADFQDGKYQGRTGWNAGVDLRFRGRKFFIQPGMHYFSSSLELTREDSVSNAPLLSGPRIHSLKAPLMLGLYLTRAKGGFFRFNVKGGVVGNYVLHVDKNDDTRFNDENIEDFSYGLNAGIGLEFGFITLDFSHEWGMSPLFKDTNRKTNVARATLGFKL